MKGGTKKALGGSFVCFSEYVTEDATCRVLCVLLLSLVSIAQLPNCLNIYEAQVLLYLHGSCSYAYRH